MDRSPADSRDADRPITGIVLAAGHSRRMARPKALLRAGDARFIERAVRTLRAGGCREVVAVVRPANDDAARRAERAGAHVLVNHTASSEQIDSLRLALAALPENAAAVMVLPVDQPRVQVATVAALLAAFRARHAPVVRPTYRGEPGHPTLFARSIFAELLDPALAEGARSVVRAHAADLEDVPLDDAGITADIDTPADYRRYVEAHER